MNRQDCRKNRHPQARKAIDCRASDYADSAGMNYSAYLNDPSGSLIDGPWRCIAWLGAGRRRSVEADRCQDMPESHVFDFVEPYSFQAAIREGTFEVLVRSRGDFKTELIRITLDRLLMQRSESNLPWIMRSWIDPARSPIVFLADTNQASTHQGGEEMSADQIAVYRSGVDHSWTEGPSRLATMSLTREDLDAAAGALTGRRFPVPSDSYLVRPDGRSMARLRALHQAAGQLAKAAPDCLAKPAIAMALEQELVHAMVACLTEPGQTDAKACAGQHGRVMKRFEEFLATKRHEPVYLAEICAALSVSERTLRTCCREHLGIGPIRYLWLRRMHLARRALLRGEPAETSVTEIATEHGFWELGRFSVEYRRLFGESPSTSLQRPPDESLGQRTAH
jgi:AraC-like DNA-binding protein